MGPKVLEQARARASQERSKALAQRASGRTKFKQAERTMQQAQTLARERKTEASARAYFDAADLFASAATGAAAGGALLVAKKTSRFRKPRRLPSLSLLPRLRRRNPIRRPPVPNRRWPLSIRSSTGMRRRCRAAIAGRCWRCTRTRRRRCWPLSASGPRLQHANRQQVHGQRFAWPARGGVECGARVPHGVGRPGRETRNASCSPGLCRRVLADRRQSLTRAPGFRFDGPRAAV